MTTEKFAGAAVNFTKSPLGIIALFIVLIYGLASLVVGFCTDISGQLLPLIYFMTYFPVLVFIGFLWLVAKHHNKLYGPSDFKNEDNYLRAQMASAISLAVAAAKRQNETIDLNSEDSIQRLTEAVLYSTRKEKHQLCTYRILWVDDHPENNFFERKAFEAQGIEFSLASSTNEALKLLKTNNFAAIISDMDRKEGSQEGYVLLKQLRESGHSIPFMIYSSSDSTEHKRMAKSKGALGSTNRADELFTTVMDAVRNQDKS